MNDSIMSAMYCILIVKNCIEYIDFIVLSAVGVVTWGSIDGDKKPLTVVIVKGSCGLDVLKELGGLISSLRY
jgi:hypothetical protein